MVSVSDIRLCPARLILRLYREEINAQRIRRVIRWNDAPNLQLAT